MRSRSRRACVRYGAGSGRARTVAFSPAFIQSREGCGRRASRINQRRTSQLSVANRPRIFFRASLRSRTTSPRGVAALERAVLTPRAHLAASNPPRAASSSADSPPDSAALDSHVRPRRLRGPARRRARSRHRARRRSRSERARRARGGVRARERRRARRDAGRVRGEDRRGRLRDARVGARRASPRSRTRRSRRRRPRFRPSQAWSISPSSASSPCWRCKGTRRRRRRRRRARGRRSGSCAPSVGRAGESTRPGAEGATRVAEGRSRAPRRGAGHARRLALVQLFLTRPTFLNASAQLAVPSLQITAPATPAFARKAPASPARDAGRYSLLLRRRLGEEASRGVAQARSRGEVARRETAGRGRGGPDG